MNKTIQALALPLAFAIVGFAVVQCAQTEQHDRATYKLECLHKGGTMSFFNTDCILPR